MELSREIRAAEAMPSRGDSLVRLLHRRRWFILFVILPALLATVYYGLIAADMYESESRFVIKNPAQKQAQATGLASFIQSTGISSGHDQTNEVIDYIHSRDALKALEKDANVKAIFSNRSADVISRYPGPFKDERFENLYKYYRKMIDVSIDHDTNSAVLRVKAFTSEDAQKLNLRLLELGEQVVNRLNSRFQTKAIAEAEQRVRDAQAKVRNARMALRAYRNSHDVLDPTEEATGVFKVSNELIAQQAAMMAQLQAMERAAPRNPGIAALRARINAIGAQIAAQTGRAVGTDNGLASKLTQYESLKVDQEFATQMLTMASATLEQARTEALKQQYYLERIVEPDQPDVALYPKRLQNILTVIGAALALYLIGWMLIVGILEHSPD
ncbi:Wzz/FepE/Etk N-terminal domain-containing protein [Novosphingobium pentaromativorans]|uniref:WcbD n=1 Tax=Novosphingobium pentaromativorans US6-1 TaxID=1088721 RepID=G6EKP1_9SPHN|nr:Wzz/FepE/Etk N-terminal domain-containing protein [Novosphingobium pentaromativorans]AIT82835.1 capsule biosynthesis protein [Novosphingobium pentaromativorans US6-1]EHJ58134.1 WcbD [Novosphingobium pentaromativorans US6-1]